MFFFVVVVERDGFFFPFSSTFCVRFQVFESNRCVLVLYVYVCGGKVCEVVLDGSLVASFCFSVVFR